MRERNIDQLPLARALTRDQACAPTGNELVTLFALWDKAQPIELHQSGHVSSLFTFNSIVVIVYLLKNLQS